MTIKKFKNGKIKLELQKQYDINKFGDVNENVYHDDMVMNDLYIDTIEGYYYIIDYNTQTVYNYYNSYFLQNPLKSLLDDLQADNRIYLYPASDSIELFNQKNNELDDHVYY